MNRFFTCPQTGLVRDWIAEQTQYNQQEQAIKKAGRAIRRAAIDRVYGRFELESDEFQTADQKAAAILGY